MARNGKASLHTFRDLDLLLKLQEEADSDGSIETAVLSQAMGLETAQEITSRLSWMKRYGMLAFDDKARIWRLTPGAERVTKARLRAAHSTALDSMPEEQMVDVMAHVTGRWRHADPMVATMLRREFIFGTGRR